MQRVRSMSSADRPINWYWLSAFNWYWLSAKPTWMVLMQIHRRTMLSVWKAFMQMPRCITLNAQLYYAQCPVVLCSMPSFSFAEEVKVFVETSQVNKRWESNIASHDDIRGYMYIFWVPWVFHVCVCMCIRFQWKWKWKHLCLCVVGLNCKLETAVTRSKL